MSDLAVRAAPARLNFNRLWVAPPLIVLALTFLYPLVLIARAALVGDAGEIDFGGFLSGLHSRAFLNALINTGLIALASSAGCLALGLTLSLILAFVPFPGSTFVARLIDTFIALPTFLVTLAFTFLYGSAGMLNGALTQSFGLSEPPVHFLYSAWGVILAEVTVYTPFVLRPLLAAFSLVDQSQIEVAGLLGARPWRIVRSVILPAALPAAIAGGSLCLLLTVNEFGIVLFIGAKGVITLPLLIYDKAIQESDYQAACTIALVNIAPLARALLALPIRSPAAWRLSRMLVWSRSGRFVVWLVAALPYRHPLHCAACGHPRASLARQWNGVLPTGFHPRTLRIRRRRRLGRFGARKPHHRAHREPSRASLRILGGAGFARPRGGMEPNLGPLVLHSERRAVGVGGARAPGRVQPAAAAPQWHDSDRDPRSFRADLGLLFRQCLGRPRPADPGLRGDRVASRRTSGLPLLKVTLPLIAPYLIAAFGLSFALSMGELGATVMVYPPGWVTLPVAIFGLTDRGDIFSGAALTMILSPRLWRC